VNICNFYQGWRGYCLTGDLHLQKALFMTGRGANGKSILNSFDSASWGKEIYGELSMAAFSQDGNANNDHLYQIRDTRCTCIMENTTSGKMNEELFKKVCPLASCLVYK
jgi:phage/plasmid-associated DNA primase